MKNEKYISPEVKKESYHCPHCGVLAHQKWANITLRPMYDEIYQLDTFNIDLDYYWRASFCEHCKNVAIWLDEEMVYPQQLIVETPNEFIDDDIQEDYLEAAEIVNKSPRGAAALLRLALQKLLKQLGESGENINEDIKSLIQKGLNPTIQKALDYVRVTGNNAVHPGVIDLKDNKDIALKLFSIINFIAEKMIEEPQEIEDWFEHDIPEEEKNKINNRNDRLSGSIDTP